MEESILRELLLLVGIEQGLDIPSHQKLENCTKYKKLLFTRYWTSDRTGVESWKERKQGKRPLWMSSFCLELAGLRVQRRDPAWSPAKVKFREAETDGYCKAEFYEGSLAEEGSRKQRGSLKSWLSTRSNTHRAKLCKDREQPVGAIVNPAIPRAHEGQRDIWTFRPAQVGSWVFSSWAFNEDFKKL